jgi:hypothetical protein
MSRSQLFHEPIVLEDGTTLRTLRQVIEPGSNGLRYRFLGSHP